MMKILIVILLFVVLSGCAPTVVHSQAEQSVYLPQVEDALLALPLDDHILWVRDDWKADNRYRVFIDREFFEILKNAPNPVGFEGNLHRKVQWQYFSTHVEFEQAIWSEDGEGLWISTDDWSRGVIHYQ